MPRHYACPSCGQGFDMELRDLSRLSVLRCPSCRKKIDEPIIETLNMLEADIERVTAPDGSLIRRVTIAYCVGSIRTLAHSMDFPVKRQPEFDEAAMIAIAKDNYHVLITSLVAATAGWPITEEERAALQKGL